MMNQMLMIFACFAGVLVSVNGQQKLSVPLGGNSWITAHSKAGNETITENGWQNWSESDTTFSTYLYLEKPGKLSLSAIFNVPTGESVIQCTIENETKSVAIAGSGNETAIGEWTVKKAGYLRIDMRGTSKTGAVFATVENLLVSGSSVDEKTAFVKNNEDNSFYWGRRGPSVHLTYDTSAAGREIEYFYSEINVPAGNDVIGSYFMANGFAEGYFGIQVNSPTERRVLFSVWSPFQTDNPAEIPPDKRILMLKKGKDVVTGNFGNEGSGGQSFLRYPWKAGETYQFLLKGEPVENNHTNYTAWFFAEGKWRLIASFSRPATTTHLTSFHSFLENFDTKTGNIARQANYQNQWVRAKGKEWQRVTKAEFTYDNTAAKNHRLDYSGGVEGSGFYLRNCGFFSERIPYQSVFSRPADGSAPNIDLSKLE
ncbi:MAG: DUF3472 domain-containing protein [Verrucomicrobiota bacterium]